jgi:hypothetical protein
MTTTMIVPRSSAGCSGSGTNASDVGARGDEIEDKDLLDVPVTAAELPELELPIPIARAITRNSASSG